MTGIACCCVLAQSNREPERLIILYDNDERVAAPAGNLFYEKGVDNAYVLTSGLTKLVGKCPHLLEGTLAVAAANDCSYSSRPGSAASSLMSISSRQHAVGAPSFCSASGNTLNLAGSCRGSGLTGVFR
eukprot:jgi/Chrzof1/6708/Cz19g06120.t1